MKINYIANVRMPTEKAHGVQIMKMCEAWGKNHQVVLWAPKRFNYIKADPFDFYGVNKNFEIKKILSFDLLPWAGIFGRLAFWVENLSFAIFLSARFLFKRQAIFFGRDFWSAYFLSFLGKKVVYEIHDSPNRHFITRRAFKKIKKFVATNNSKAEDLKNNFGIQKEKIFVAPNGVDSDFFSIKESKEECRKILNLPVDKKIVLYNGHLYSWKGADTLLSALLRMEGDDVHGVFVGGTSGDVAKFRVAAGADKRISIIGHQEYRKIPYFLKAADIFVLPNTAKEQISLKDTSPIKLFEYMVAGRPIIASDIPSVREIVSEKEVVFFKADDAVDLQEKIEMVVNNYDNYQDRIDAAKDLAANYSWQNRADRILKFII